ncbi:ATP-binding protein [Streptomyces sp. CB01881]|uniref:ATP-binding protein n=1 Tax=Streptomyces sp. CB01881 TaxID=2078691 RepID=UPI000CDBDBBA|nr:ATP-binding protein [Streptomyces sp. CB01881]AUY51427.1 ATP-binding protein [Streptomyces sp. CB01881]TYC74818.1 ATP-binding protein [Streptomyces sp. CB01881]
MKQATLKAAGAAVLGIAIAAVGAGSASADPAAAGGLGLPTGAVTNPAVTGAVVDTAGKLPGGDKVAGTLGTLGTLTPSAGQAVAPAADAPRAAVPSVPGLGSTPLGGLTQTLPLPGLGG